MQQERSLGTLPLYLRKNRFFTVTGGPARACRGVNMILVKMAAEVDRDCHIDIPTQDFNTPPPELLSKGLEKAVKAILEGRPLYVGCMAGKGRTGLFMAILAKAFDIPDPVEYVRENYYSHAVETTKQYQFVMEFPIPERIKKDIFWAKVRSYFTFRKALTNF